MKSINVVNRCEIKFQMISNMFNELRSNLFTWLHILPIHIYSVSNVKYKVDSPYIFSSRKPCINTNTVRVSVMSCVCVGICICMRPQKNVVRRFRAYQPADWKQQSSGAAVVLIGCSSILQGYRKSRVTVGRRVRVLIAMWRAEILL